MRSLVKRAAVVAAGLVAIATVPAAGASWLTYDVEVDGSAVPGEHPVEIWSNEPIDFSVSSSVTGNPVNMGCTDMESLPDDGAVVGSGAGIDQFIRFGDVRLLICVLAGGIGWNVNVDEELVVRGLSSASQASTDVVEVRIDDFRVEFRSQIPNVCNFNLVGSLPGEYREATSELVLEDSGFDGSLVVENVVGCGGAFAHGDAASFSTTLALWDENGHPVDLNLVS